MLRVIGDGAGEPARLQLEDLPLGPWAGVEVHLWTTKSGTRWHGDPDCSALRSEARSEVFRQPDAGVLGHRVLPAKVHCDPPGPLGRYVLAAHRLVKLMSATRDAEDRFDAGDLALDVLPCRYDWWLDRGERAEMAFEPLASLWEEEFRRREEIVRRVQEVLDPAGERMAVMAIADWVAQGRTPREHQLRYERFVEVAAAEFAGRELSTNFGAKWFVNQEALPGWLGAVVGGQACGNATSALALREGERTRRFLRPGEEDLPERVVMAWTAIGNRWQQMVEAMAWAHPGSVLAMFHLYESSVDRGLVDAYMQVGPAAQLEVGNLDWIVAHVPAALRLSLAERVRGLSGLVLAQERLHRVDAECCRRFLRNVVTSLGYPELAEFVTVPGAGLDAGSERSRAQVEVRMPDPLQSFASDTTGLGLTTSHCGPALRAAVEGTDLTSQRAVKAPQRRR